MMKQLGIFLSLLLMLSFASCGYRTSPSPIIEVEKTFHNLQVQQRGGKVRLSWEMIKPIPETLGVERFFIQERVVRKTCLECTPEPLRFYTLPFPSQHFEISGLHVFNYPPQIHKDTSVHYFTIAHQTKEGKTLGLEQEVQFKGFVEFPKAPAPQIRLVDSKHLKRLQTVFLPGLSSDLHQVPMFMISWVPVVEKAVLRFNTGEEMLKNSLYYAVNLYKTRQGYPWPEQPFKAKIKDGFFILPQDVSPRPIDGPKKRLPFRRSFIEYYQQQNNNHLYHLRLVDAQGNESSPSKAIIIPVSLEPSVPSTPL
ncbi:hypothetical protein WDW89_12185 [Deltaproteobacteria bacterium TL4]